MPGQLLTVPEITALIEQGERLLLAGDESLLAALPRGTWIGGTIPYFMTAAGGQIDREHIYVDRLPDDVTEVRIERYRAEDLPDIVRDRFDNGYSIIVLPATSEAHLRYAADAADYRGIFDQPVVGWVAGVHLDDIGTVSAKVFSGDGSAPSADEAVVMHARLPGSAMATLDIINLFQQSDGPALTFDDTGFTQHTVYVDGVAHDFGAYLRSVGHDTRLPLVADYFGALVNVSIQDVPEHGDVALYAPVFKGVDYRLANPLNDYVGRFEKYLGSHQATPDWSCNCILNFVYSELEGKHTGQFTGPVTFGEIAFQLLNQTLVYLTIHR